MGLEVVVDQQRQQVQLHRTQVRLLERQLTYPMMPYSSVHLPEDSASQKGVSFAPMSSTGLDSSALSVFEAQTSACSALAGKDPELSGRERRLSGNRMSGLEKRMSRIDLLMRGDSQQSLSEALATTAWEQDGNVDLIGSSPELPSDLPGSLRLILNLAGVLPRSSLSGTSNRVYSAYITCLAIAAFAGPGWILKNLAFGSLFLGWNIMENQMTSLLMLSLWMIYIPGWYMWATEFGIDGRVISLLQHMAARAFPWAEMIGTIRAFWIALIFFVSVLIAYHIAVFAGGTSHGQLLLQVSDDKSHVFLARLSLVVDLIGIPSYCLE